MIKNLFTQYRNNAKSRRFRKYKKRIASLPNGLDRSLVKYVWVRKEVSEAYYRGAIDNHMFVELAELLTCYFKDPKRFKDWSRLFHTNSEVALTGVIL